MTGDFRVGLGFDVHPLVSGRRLVLGGVEVPFAKGLSGWSDGDVLAHAIIDALLGAASLGDIGQHFPPGKSEYKNVSSLVLLRRVKDELSSKGWVIGNIDTIVIAEKPKLQDFIEPVRQKIAQALGISRDIVSVKAKTTNEIGPIARGEGIAAQAIALIKGENSENI